VNSNTLVCSPLVFIVCTGSKIIMNLCGNWDEENIVKCLKR
jgi:hypothetical protein